MLVCREVCATGELLYGEERCILTCADVIIDGIEKRARVDRLLFRVVRRPQSTEGHLEFLRKGRAAFHPAETGASRVHHAEVLHLGQELQRRIQPAIAPSVQKGPPRTGRSALLLSAWDLG